MLTFGSLFAGIGGFDLGFERAGMKCKWQVEIDEYARRVLEKHWPDVPRYGDIRTITKLPYVDVVCGGFPCQDITHAGKGAGIHGAKSSLWFEMLRIIRMVRPPYVVVENSAALCEKGLDTVLAGLAASGYNAEWQVLPSSAFGASHERKRTFLVAYSDSFGRQGILCNDTQDGSEKDYGTKAQPALGTVWNRLSRLEKELGEPSVFGEDDGLPKGLYKSVVAYEEKHDKETLSKIEAFNREILRELWKHRESAKTPSGLFCPWEYDDFVSKLPQELAYGVRFVGERIEEDEELCNLWQRICSAPFEETQNVQQKMLDKIRAIEREQAMVSHYRIDRLRCCGNAVVPQVAEFIGRRIVEAEGA